ncbi:MAG: DNA polymerase III subunit beta [Rikenellaceae bacterium]
MKFTVSSQALQQLLATMGKVISNKSTFPILDYFLLELKGDELTVTTSDSETMMVSSIKVDSVEQEGSIAAPSKRLQDTLKGFADMPITFDIDSSSWEIKMNWISGSISIPGTSPESYPKMKDIAQERREVSIDVDNLITGINKTIFATADDDLRPIMNGIFFNIEEDKVTFVATDAHKLVRCSAKHSGDGGAASFILPKKSANLLKGIVTKAGDTITMLFDSQNAKFAFDNFTLMCRLIDGNYPNYNAVIPTNNSNKVVVDRQELLNAIRRVAVCSNQAKNLICLDVEKNSIMLTADDVDYSASAQERLSCSYDGDNIRIGFKSIFLVEILTNLESESVVIELGDATRAGVFKEEGNDNESGVESLMLLMPMIIPMS